MTNFVINDKATDNTFGAGRNYLFQDGAVYKKVGVATGAEAKDDSVAGGKLVAVDTLRDYTLFGTKEFTLKERVEKSIFSTALTSYFAIPLTVTITEPSKIILFWRYKWSHNDTASDFVSEIHLDGANIDNDAHREEIQDSGGGGGGGTDQRHTNSGFTVTSLPVGTYVYDLLYATSNNSVESTIYTAELAVFRVS